MSKHAFKPLGPLFGITGYTSSGKSVISQYLRSIGYGVVVFDELLESLLEDSNVKEILLKEFSTNNLIHLKLLMESSPEVKNKINLLVSIPAMKKAFILTNELFQQGHKAVFWESSLLIETDTFKNLSGLIIVDCEKKICEERFVLKHHIPKQNLNPYFRNQISLEEKQEKLLNFNNVFIIENNSSLSEFKLNILGIEPWVIQKL